MSGSLVAEVDRVWQELGGWSVQGVAGAWWLEWAGCVRESGGWSGQSVAGGLHQ